MNGAKQSVSMREITSSLIAPRQDTFQSLEGTRNEIRLSADRLPSHGQMLA